MWLGLWPACSTCRAWCGKHLPPDDCSYIWMTMTWWYRTYQVSDTGLYYRRHERGRGKKQFRTDLLFTFLFLFYFLLTTSTSRLQPFTASKYSCSARVAPIFQCHPTDSADGERTKNIEYHTRPLYVDGTYLRSGSCLRVSRSLCRWLAIRLGACVCVWPIAPPSGARYPPQPVPT